MKSRTFLLVSCVLLVHSVHAQLTYTQVTNGLTDVYESGNTILAVGDIDKDGDLDIISVGDHYSPLIAEEHGIMVFFNNGTGTAWTKNMNGDFGYGGVVMGDVNNDGHWDLAYGVHHSYASDDFGDQILEVVLGDGTGMNWTPYDDNLGMQGQDWGMFGCDFADVDNDGLLDLGANAFGCCDGVWIYKNNGNGTWAAVGGVLNSTDNSNHQFSFGDFDRDGKADFIANNTRFNDQTFQVWKNNGNNTFSPMTAGLPFSGAWGDFQFKMAVTDINHDGAADIAITSGNYAQVYTFDIVTNTWVNASSGLPTTSQSGLLVAMGDLDADGHTDLATYKPGIITLYTGDGAGNWVQAATLPIPETTGYDLKLADLDNNGYLDIIYWAKYNGANMLRVYLQTSVASELTISPVFPDGGELFCHGSAQFIKWTSSVPPGNPGTVTIELSATGPNGPFSTIASGLPNSGLYQWNIPGISSVDCYLKFTITNGTLTNTAITGSSFVLDNCTGLPVIPGPVSGDTTVCAGAQLFYSIPAAPNATGYQWTLPPGWSGSSNTIVVAAFVGNTGGTISVIATSPQGNSLPQTLNVSVSSVDTSVSQNGIVLTANQAGANYQWINCVTGMVIAGDTNQNFTPSVNGSYAVIVSDLICTDTSGCHSVFVTGIQGNTAAMDVSVMPNPCFGVVRITADREIHQLELLNVTGEKIFSDAVNGRTYLLDLSSMQSGVYFLMLKSGDTVVAREIIRM